MSTFYGLVELVLYVAAILALSAAVTYAVVRISPAKSARPANGQRDPEGRGLPRPFRLDLDRHGREDDEGVHVVRHHDRGVHASIREALLDRSKLCGHDLPVAREPDGVRRDEAEEVSAHA